MTADCFVYEAEEDIWISAPPMAIARQMHSMVMLNGTPILPYNMLYIIQVSYT